MVDDGKRFGELLDSDPDRAWREFLDEYSASIFGVIRFYERDPDRASDCFLFVCEGLCRNRLQRLRRFDPSGPAAFPTWLRAVVRNLWLDWRRKKFGRFRLFRSIESLSSWEQELFHSIYRRGMGPEEAFLALKPRFPELSGTDVRQGIARVQERLTPHQHWLLSRLVRQEIEADDIVDERPDPESQTLGRERTDLLAREIEKLPAEDRLLVKLRFEKDLSLSQMAEVMGFETPQKVDRRLRKILSTLRRALEQGKRRLSSV